MASKKGSRSSKTDHVLNLLSHPSSPEPQQSVKDKTAAEAAPSTPAAGESAPQSNVIPPREERHLTPPVLEVARANNEALEETIREALENALAQEDPAAAEMSVPAEEAAPAEEPAPAKEPAPMEELAPAEESAPIEEPAPVEEEPTPAEEPAPMEDPASIEELAPIEEPTPAEEPAPVEELAPADEPAPVEEPALVEEPAPVEEEPTLVEEPVSAEEPASVEESTLAEEPISSEEPASVALPTPEEASLIKPEDTLPDESRFVNVMVPLVEEKLLKYVRLFHLCECPRCLADVKALALSRLPAKYVVLEGMAYTPMMSYYQAKFDSPVTAQIVYACKQVMESPRHGKMPRQKN